MTDQGIPLTPDESRIVALRNIRWAIAALNGLLIVAGLILVLLGAKVNEEVERVTSNSKDIPPLWYAGCTPLLVGSLGILGAFKGGYPIRAWVVFTIGASIGSTAFLSELGCLNPALYGVNVNIYNDCDLNATNCICVWNDADEVVTVGPTYCRTLENVTTLYLTAICVLIFSLTTCAVTCTLATVISCCLKSCTTTEQHRKEVPRLSLPLSIDPTDATFVSSHPVLLNPLLRPLKEDAALLSVAAIKV